MKDTEKNKPNMSLETGSGEYRINSSRPARDISSSVRGVMAFRLRTTRKCQEGGKYK